MASDALARDALLPRVEARLGLGAALALLAHAGLIGALALGLNWRLPRQTTSASAELWAAVPQVAAPRAAPEPPQPQAPTPQVAPTLPVQPAVPVPPDAAELEAEIALEKARQRERQRKEQQDTQRQKLKLERALEDKRLADDKALKSAQKLAQQRDQQTRDEKAREDKRLRDLADQRERQHQADEAKAQDALLSRQREENLRRMLGQAGAAGAANATGNASHDAAPSASYGGRIKATIKPLIIYTAQVVGNATAEVEVKCAPDGSILSRRVTQPSGNPAWDEAVLRAIDRARALPRDTDGRIPPTMLLTFPQRD